MSCSKKSKQEIDMDEINSTNENANDNENENLNNSNDHDSKCSEPQNACLITAYFDAFAKSAREKGLISAEKNTSQVFYQCIILINAWKSQRVNAGLKTPLNNANDTAIIFGNMLDFFHRYDVNCKLLLAIFNNPNKSDVDSIIEAAAVDWDDLLEV